MKFISPLVICFFFFFTTKAQLTGVVNFYSEVTAISGLSLTVNGNSSFNVGDKILIIQMKGATINITNTSSYGTISSLNNAGNYAFLTIASKSGTGTIVTTSVTPVAFTTGGTNRVQIVSVKTIVGNATVTGNVLPTAWNGTIGGIVVLEIQGSLTINAGFRIDGSALGFRGGSVSGISNGTAWCNWSEFRSINIITPCYDGIYAQKGEGIAEDSPNDYARGPQANGGGGSGEHNGGGGGGGNVSIGGDGGRQLSGCPYRRTNAACSIDVTGAVTSSTCNAAVITSTSDVMVGGIGGNSLTCGSTNNKIFMGGGGGGGQQNGGGGTSGAAGGGILVISTNSIINNSTFADAIRSNGGTPANTTGNEGAGGGGAGGTILLETGSFNNAITLSVGGGRGGNAVTNNIVCRGPGGGGGGGLIWINGLTTAPANLTTDILSGTSGSVICSNAAACGGAAGSATSLTCLGNLSYCAVSPPSNGTVIANVVIPLPLEISEFYTRCLEDHSEIILKTVSEKNVDYFIIQKSADGIHWMDLEKITAIGSGTGNSYSIKDHTFNKALVVYYRIKTFNRDGSVDYSTIISGKCKANEGYDFLVAENSGMDITFTRIPKSFKIYNLLGQLIQETQTDGGAFYHVSTAAYARGIYLVIADFGSQTSTKKLILNYY